MEKYQACYQQYVRYFRQTFPFAQCLSFEEWTREMQIPQIQHQPQHQQSENQPLFEPNEQDLDEISTKDKSRKTVLKRDTWTSQQTGALINAWKENFVELETFRQVSAWLKVKVCVDKHGPAKTETNQRETRTFEG